MVALEDRFPDAHRRDAFAEAREHRRSQALVEHRRRRPVDEPVDFPTWNRRGPVRLIRRLSQATWILPLARAVRACTSRGASTSRSQRPGVFASNHQSHMDVPVILWRCPGRWRRGSRRRWPRSSSRRTSSRQGTRGAQGSPTRSTTTWPRSSSTRSRCRSARPARGRRCDTSARSPATAGRS